MEKALIVLVIWFLAVFHEDSTQNIIRRYPSTLDDSIRFTHLIVDQVTGKVYAGATNQVLQLSADLHVEHITTTGPVEDNPECAPRWKLDNCGDVQKLTNNVNKVLVLDRERGVLIACGSVFQGACEKYNLTNISSGSEFFPTPVAANDDYASTYAYIGPETYSANNISTVLYVGTTFTNKGDYRPAIASRELTNLKLASFETLSDSNIYINDKYRDNFLVRYVYGFNTSDYAYFALVQKQSYSRVEEYDYVSKLARVCVSDLNYDSYMEVTLQCLVNRDNNTRIYNLIQDAKLAFPGVNLAAALQIKVNDPVLIGVFSPSRGSSDEPLSDSAVCVFSLLDIEVKFDENIRMCLNNSKRNMGYISGASEESCDHFPTESHFCSIPASSGQSLKINGTIPISAAAIQDYSNIHLSSVTIEITGNHTIGFLGTRDGSLKKVVLDYTKVLEYAKTDLSTGHTILPDTALNINKDMLYVLTNHSILLVPVEECSLYTTCSECLESIDPHCGWCLLEKRCTPESVCKSGAHTWAGWLTYYKSQVCIHIEMLSPDRVPMSEMITVHLTIRNLPGLQTGAKYMCVFGAAPPINASITTDGLTCLAPTIYQRPEIPKTSDHVSISLSVYHSITGKKFISQNFSFFDCSTHTTCSKCVSNQWACVWCIYDNKCAYNSSVCHKMIMNDDNNPNELKDCPRIRRSPTPILIPNNITKELSLEIENLPYLRSEDSGFECEIRIGVTNMTVPARVESNNLIVCNGTPYSYEENVGEYNISVKIIWNYNHYIDIIEMTLYKCEILGSHRERADCSLCTIKNSLYQCTWCNNSCSYKSCSEIPAAKCPRPRIDTIKPPSGPIEGGTLVTIEGSNLGTAKNEIMGNVHIGDVPCEIVNFETSVSVTCRTGESNRPMEAPVRVGNEAGETTSIIQFSYENIKLEKIYPSIGPVSGGTQLLISGQRINVGSEISVYLDELICKVNNLHTSDDWFICTTTEAQSARVIQKLTVLVDNANRTIFGNLFNYIVDPTIIEIKPLKSFISGGKMIRIHGTNLHTIQKPQLNVFYSNELVPVNGTICTVLNSNQMECPSPAINKKFEEVSLQSSFMHIVNATSEVVTKISFTMDSVESVRDLERHFQTLRSQMVYVDDPQVYVFPNKIKHFKGDFLVIEGENMNMGCDESDVSITIGTGECNLTSLTVNQIICTPPEMQPNSTNENGYDIGENGLPMVTVKFGKTLKFPIGYLEYEETRFPSESVAGAAVGVFLLVLIFVIVIVIYRRRSNKAEKECKETRVQMDTLERNVRKQCKQTFVELQTDLSDLTADLEGCGIPTLDHAKYVMKIFFPDNSNHPILTQTTDCSKTEHDVAMTKFEQLLNNKCFLLSFIDTLESQKSFDIRDKVNVASLLMVVLMGNMEYVTDILKCLLLRLIDKSVSTKHPQLMLRRAESVVEKMLINWMALCMYYNLKDYAGPSLFILFKAIKHQVDKGLVDAITHEARYCLSEEKLLKEHIDHQVITIHIVQDDRNEQVQCKVLDYDTISQVKSKILDALYKNNPFSSRPLIQDVGLEWWNGTGHLTLQDKDLTTKAINGWEKLNTLVHYGIKESAIMSLTLRKNNSLNTRLQINKNADSIDNSFTYHLVKPIVYNQLTSKTSKRQQIAIPEIFLNRLLYTKGIINKYVENFFSAILTVNEFFPPAVKWLFDLFDEAARMHGITNPEVVHIWKSNSLSLRFWINLIKNPDFIFDIEKTETVNSCLTVIAQAFMDSCSTSEIQLDKDSPSNKLLFAKDIPLYRRKVLDFFNSIFNLPQVTEQEINNLMRQLSHHHVNKFNTVPALKELYTYVKKYKDPITNAFKKDPSCNNIFMATLEFVTNNLQTEQY